MSTTFILFYILAIIIALLGLAGLVILINGLISQNKKQLWRGSIFIGITLILIISGVFCGARKCYRVCQQNCMNKEIKYKHMDYDHCRIMCDSMMMDNKMKCDTSKCDPAKCKPDCPHKK